MKLQLGDLTGAVEAVCGTGCPDRAPLHRRVRDRVVRRFPVPPATARAHRARPAAAADGEYDLADLTEAPRR